MNYQLTTFDWLRTTLCCRQVVASINYGVWDLETAYNKIIFECFGVKELLAHHFLALCTFCGFINDRSAILCPIISDPEKSNIVGILNNRIKDIGSGDPLDVRYPDKKQCQTAMESSAKCLGVAPYYVENVLCMLKPSITKSVKEYLKSSQEKKRKKVVDINVNQYNRWFDPETYKHNDDKYYVDERTILPNKKKVDHVSFGQKFYTCAFYRGPVPQFSVKYNDITNVMPSFLGKINCLVRDDVFQGYSESYGREYGEILEINPCDGRTVSLGDTKSAIDDYLNDSEMLRSDREIIRQKFDCNVPTNMYNIVYGPFNGHLSLLILLASQSVEYLLDICYTSLANKESHSKRKVLLYGSHTTFLKRILKLSQPSTYPQQRYDLLRKTGSDVDNIHNLVISDSRLKNIKDSLIEIALTKIECGLAEKKISEEDEDNWNKTIKEAVNYGNDIFQKCMNPKIHEEPLLPKSHVKTNLVDPEEGISSFRTTPFELQQDELANDTTAWTFDGDNIMQEPIKDITVNNNIINNVRFWDLGFSEGPPKQVVDIRRVFQDMVGGPLQFTHRINCHAFKERHSKMYSCDIVDRNGVDVLSTAGCSFLRTKIIRVNILMMTFANLKPRSDILTKRLRWLSTKKKRCGVGNKVDIPLHKIGKIQKKKVIHITCRFKKKHSTRKQLFF